MDEPVAANPEKSNVMIVFGATGGIGSALCRMLRNRGNQLLLVARTAETVETLAAELDAVGLVADATQFTDVDRVFDEAMNRFAKIDGVANCVGSLLLKPAHNTSEVEYAQTIAASLTSAFAVCRAAGRTMTAGGSVVLVASAAALAGIPNHEAIAAAKAGIVGLTMSAAATYASKRIRFNAVAPGLTRTPLTTRLTANEVSERASRAMHPLGRLGETADVARAMSWFLDPANNWVTGQVLAVDGGLSSLRAPVRA